MTAQHVHPRMQTTAKACSLWELCKEVTDGCTDKMDSGDVHAKGAVAAAEELLKRIGPPPAARIRPHAPAARKSSVGPASARGEGGGEAQRPRRSMSSVGGGTGQEHSNVRRTARSSVSTLQPHSEQFEGPGSSAAGPHSTTGLGANNKPEVAEEEEVAAEAGGGADAGMQVLPAQLLGAGSIRGCWAPAAVVKLQSPTKSFVPPPLRRSTGCYSGQQLPATSLAMPLRPQPQMSSPQQLPTYRRKQLERAAIQRQSRRRSSSGSSSVEAPSVPLSTALEALRLSEQHKQQMEEKRAAAAMGPGGNGQAGVRKLFSSE